MSSTSKLRATALAAAFLAALSGPRLAAQTITQGQVINSGSETGNISVAGGVSFTVEGATAFSGGTTSFGGSNTIYLPGSTTLTLQSSEIWNLAGNLNFYGQGSGITFTNNGAVNAVGGWFSGQNNGNFLIQNGGTITNTANNLQLGYYTGDSLSNTGTITSTANGNSSSISIGGSTNTLSNSNLISAVASGGGSATVTFGNSSGTTATNSGTISAMVNGSGYATANVMTGGGGGTFANTGTISATGANAVINLATGGSNSWTNSGGMLSVTNGATLNLGGSFNNASFGMINGAGGTVNLVGSLSNSGTLAGPTTGTFVLDGGTITGGSISGTNSKLVFGSGGGTLNNVALQDNFTIGQNTVFTLAGTSAFSGNVAFGGSNSVNLASAGALTIANGITWSDSGNLNLYAETSGVTVANNGTMALNGGWVSGQNNGNFLTQNTGTITNSSNNLQLGYYTGDSFSNSGTVTASSTNGSYASITIGGSTNTLSNTNAISATTVGSGSSTVTFGSGSGTTATNSGTIAATVSGSGYATANVMTGGGGGTFANTGTISASGANAVINLATGGSNSWTNAGGTLSLALGATLNLGGNFNNASFGTIDGAAGTVNLVGSLTNSGTLLGPTTGTFVLDGGTITGGNISGTNNALVFSNAGGTLNNVALQNNFTIGQNTTFSLAGTSAFSGNVSFGGNNSVNLASAGALTIANGITWSDSGNLNLYAQTSGVTVANNGTMALNGGWVSGQNNGNFLVQNTGTITNSSNNLQLGYYTGDSFSNSGTVTASSTNGSYASITISGSNDTLSNTSAIGATTAGNGSSTITFGNGNNSTITNGGTISANVTSGSGSATAYIATGNGGSTFTNTGTVSASGGNATIDLATGGGNAWNNTNGILTVTQGATLNLGGTMGAATMGTIYGAGGTVNLEGLYNNSGTFAGPTTGVFNLYGGTISGGTVDGSLGVLAFTSNGGVLDNVSMVNNFTVAQNAGFTVEGTTAFGGNVTLGGNNAIYFATTGTFAMPASGTWSDSGALNFYGQTSGITIANQGNITTNGGWVSGQNNANFLLNNSGTITNNGSNNLQLGYYTGDSLTNSGTILNTTSTGNNPSLSIGGSSNTVTNGGTIESLATGNGQSNVYVANGYSSTLSNTGTLEANGANAALYVSANNSGDSWTNAGGTIEALNGGTIYLQGNFTTAGLAAGAILGAGGTLNLAGSLDNAGATLAAPADLNHVTSGIYTLDRGTISGGTVDGSLNALAFSSNGGTLNNVSMVNNFTVGQNAGFTVQGTTAFSGNVTLGGNNDIYFATGNTFTIPTNATWSDSGLLGFYAETSGVTIANQGNLTTNGGWISGQNNGNFLLNNSGTITNNGSNNLQLGYYSGDSLTNSGTILNTTSAGNNPSLSIGGYNNTVMNSGTIESLSTANGSSSVSVANGSNSVLTNTGTLEANGANATLYVSANNSGDSWTNTGGTIEALNGGTVYLQGSFTTAGLAAGAILGAGGTLDLAGSLNNAGATLAAPAGLNHVTSGIYTLDRGTITGGTVDGSLNALAFSGNGGTLNNVSMVNNFTVAQNAGFTVEGTTEFSGNVTLGGNNSIYLGTSGTVTLPASGSWTDSGGLNLYGQAAGITVANQGSIVTNGGWVSGQNYGTFLNNNSGTITNNGSSNLQLGYYSGDSLTNSGTITNQGTGGNAPTLSIGGYNNSIGNTGTIQNSNSGTGTAATYVGNESNTTITNGGMMMSTNTGAGNAYLYIGTGSNTVFTNTGTVGASGVRALTELGGSVTNLSGGTLTGGTWSASNGGTLQFSGGPITTNDATLVLDGAGSAITTSGGSQTLQQTLTTNNGTLSLDPIAFSNSNALTNNGSIQLAGATITAPSLTNTATGTITGYGGVGVQVANQGNVTANGGTLTLSNGVVGASGSVQVNSGATLSLAGGSTTSTTGTLAQNGTLALGGNNVVVSNSYTNANFGTGNGFNATAGVTGTGQILAAGNTAQTISGSAVSNGTSSAPTLTLANMRVGGSQTVSFDVNNGGTSGPSIVGALQTDVNGGNITDGRLTGSGVTAGNYGPLSSGQSQGFSVTENGTSAGALAAGQKVEVVSNFANVGPQTLSISGGAVYQPAEANTLSNVTFGNFHVGAAESTSITIQNVAPNTNGYTETLGANVTATGGPTTAAGSVTGLAQGATSNAISLGLNTGTAGVLSGSATIDFQTQAINNSGLGILDLGTQTVAVSGTAYQLAAASVQPASPISLGSSRIGGSLEQGLTVTNSAPNTNGFTETLSGNVSGNTGSATSAGSVSGVAQGASNSTGINVSLATGTAGQITGTTTLGFASNAINNSGLGTTQLQSQTVDLTGTVYQAAEGQVTNAPVDLGNFHVGDTAATTLSVKNVAPATGGYTENLGASVGSTSGSAYGSGTVSGVTVGSTNSAGITVGLNTGAAGNLSGSATVDFQTQAIDNSGLGTAAAGSQTVNVTATAYALAQASTQPTSLSLGNTRIGGTLDQNLSVTNSGPNTNGFTENLSGGVSGNTGAATSAGSISGVVQGGTNSTGINVSLATGTAGQISGSTTLGFDSNAIDNSGLGITQLQSQTVNLTGTVYQAAQGQVTNAPVDLGNFHVGDTAATTLSVKNVAPDTGGYTENLGASIGSTSGSAYGSGTVSGVTVGSTNSAGITVGLNTGAAGNLSGSATVDFQTQAINNSGLGTAAAGSQTVNVTGTAYALAQASTQPTTLSLGNTRIGGTLDQNLSVTNSGPNTNGFTENLSGSVSGNTGAATSAGSISGLVQGSTNSTGINVSLATGTAGQVTGSTTLGFASNAINNSGLGTTQLQSQTVNLSGAVYQAAQGQVTNAPINLGNFHVGDTASTTLAVQNVAPNTNGYTENLGATVSQTSGAATGSGVLSGLAQGQINSTALTVGLNTATAGALSGTATVAYTTQAINNSGLGTASVGQQTVSVQGAAYNLASGTLGTINFGRVLQGSNVSQYLSVTNSAPMGAYSEGLDASIAGFTGASASQLSGSGAITNLAAGQTNASALDIFLNTSSAGTVSGNVLVNLASDGATTSGLGITALPQQSAAISGEIDVVAQVGSLASASAVTPNPVNLGSVRIGAVSPTQALSLTNTAVGPAEGLNASISSNSGGVTAVGTFMSLQAGQTDNTDLVVGLNTSAAGAVNGTATIALASDGSYNHGVATALASQTVDVTGAVYQTAQGQVTNAPINLGNFHVGDTAATTLSVQNVAPNTNGYTENLGANIGSTTGAVYGSGSVTGVTQGSINSTGITVGLNTGTAGNLAGSATVDFQTQAINNSGLGTTAVGSQTVNVTGTAYALAQASVQPSSPVSLGNTRIGGTLAENLSVTNVGPNTNGFTENLSGGVSGNAGSATSAGSFGGVAQGSTNSTGISVSLSTGTAGQVTGSTTLGFASNAINNSGLGTTQLQSQTVDLIGAVYQTAEFNALPSLVNLGTIRVGTTVNTALDISNVAPDTGGYTENLAASFGTVSGGLSATGEVTGLGQGDSSNAMAVSFTAGHAGSFGGSADVDFDSQAINNSGLGDLALGSQTVDFSATVNALANARVGEAGGGYSFTSTGADSGTLNFGDLTEGGGDMDALMFLENDVAGPADDLASQIDAAGLAGTPFSFLGSDDMDIAAGNQDGFSLEFNTDAGTGRFEATLVFDDASHNPFQNDLGLGAYDLTIEGDVLPVNNGGGSSVPDRVPTVILLGAVLAAAAAARRWRLIEL